MRKAPVLVAALWSLSVFAQAPAGAAKPAAPAARPAESAAKPAAEPAKFEFEQFQLVLLKRSPTPPKLSDAESQELQKKHIGHLEAMHTAGYLMIAGPLSDQADPTLRGVCLYKVASLAEARRLAEQDPAVKAGRLVVDVMTWNVGKGYLAFPKAPGAAAATQTP